jgi:hypothetical protein
LIDGALAFDKAARWATAGAMQQGIVAAAHAATGSAPSRDALVDLVATCSSVQVEKDDAPEARTQRGAATPPSSSSTVDNDAPTKIRPGAAQAIRLERAARQPGLTTDQPVWNEGKATGPSRQKLAWIALAAGVLATALVTAVLLRPREQGDSPALAPATAAPGPSATTSAAGAPEQPLPPTTSEPATVSLDQLPRELPRKAQANPAAMAPAPAAKTASGPALHAATPSPPSAPAAQVPAAKSNCSPPYSLDPATGIKRWKPECM